MRSWSNSTAAATSGPARQPRPASSAPATKRTPSARSWRNSRLPEERLRRARRREVALPVRSAAATSSEEADALGRPVGGEGLPDDPLLGDGAPEPAVVGRATVVAHHEPVTGGNRHGLGQVAALAAAARLGERLLLELAVEHDVPVADRDLVARACDDALDEVHVRARLRLLQADLAGRRLAAAALVALLGAGGRVEDHDVADRGIAEVRPDAVDQHALADL